MTILILPPVVMLFTGLLMRGLNHYLPLLRFWETHFCWLGIVMMVTGIAVAQWHSRLFKKIGTNFLTFKEPDSLTTKGFYSCSRKPMYLGFLFTLTGFWFSLGSVTSMVALLGFWGLIIYWYIPLEGNALARKFGESYLNYKKSVRRWL
jgi:protein-S-isoprenylcysteine O-methyltransferase Ste14